MDEIWRVYLVALLVSVSLVCQTVGTDEYEYYYEEVNVTSTPMSTSSTASVEATSVVPVSLEVQTATEESTVIMDFETSEKPNITTIAIGSSTDDNPMNTHWTTATTAVEGQNVNLNANDVRRTDAILNGTRPTKFTNTMYKTTSKPKSQHNPPAIVLNIYTGMYGMDSRGKNRQNRNQAGRNNFWPRAQSPLQGWYGMYNRAPMQSFAPRQQRPIYRGRGQQNNYDESYNGFTYQTATKPRRNNQQNRGTTLDQQASMAVFNFLLQALGQRSGSSGRSQTQVQQGSRRKV